jgi:carbamoyltransferase
MKKYYIGLATTFHDPALAIVDNEGEVLFAEATERCLQNKRAFGLTADVRELVRKAILDHCDPNAAFVVAKPWSQRIHRFFRMMNLLGVTDHEQIPRRSQEMTRQLVNKTIQYSCVWLQYGNFVLSGGNIADILANDFGNRKVSYAKFDHHLAHAATACYTSPFDNAACAIIDGFGERGSIAYFAFQNGRLRPVAEVKGVESLGILYDICTGLCGFNVEKGEEWKVMGLAPYGKLDPDILSDFRSLVTVNDLSIRYPRLPQIESWLKRMAPRARMAGASPHEAANLACTTQFFYEEVVTELLNNFYAKGISDQLALGGGCALNSTFNGRILEKTSFKTLHVPSAPGDDGTALGAALLAFYRDHPLQKRKETFQSPFLGSSLSKTTVNNLVKFGRIPKIRQLTGTIHQETAQLLAKGKLVGWVQGRAEFGPRALGNRSILADPRPVDMKERINTLVKFREEFRPFAPSILDEFGHEYFQNYQVSPYMERTLTFNESAAHQVPAIVHVNRTGRLQSVRREWNPSYYDLIRSFYEITGVPMLLNTSFNIMGKPIIHSVEDALGLFYTTGLDVLVIENYLIEK